MFGVCLFDVGCALHVLCVVCRVLTIVCCVKFVDGCVQYVACDMVNDVVGWYYCLWLVCGVLMFNVGVRCRVGMLVFGDWCVGYCLLFVVCVLCYAYRVMGHVWCIMCGV